MLKRFNFYNTKHILSKLHKNFVLVFLKIWKIDFKGLTYCLAKFRLIFMLRGTQYSRLAKRAAVQNSSNECVYAADWTGLELRGEVKLPPAIRASSEAKLRSIFTHSRSFWGLDKCAQMMSAVPLWKVQRCGCLVDSTVPECMPVKQSTFGEVFNQTWQNICLKLKWNSESNAMSRSVLFRAKLDQESSSGIDEQEVLVHFSSGDIEAMTSCAKPTMEKRRKFTGSASR